MGYHPKIVEIIIIIVICYCYYYDNNYYYNYEENWQISNMWATIEGHGD